MSTTLLVILIAIVVIVAIAAWAWVQARRTTALRHRFGPEYERAVNEYGGKTHAEKALERRTERTEKYHIRSLTEQEQHAFSEQWRTIQARFVDDPQAAIRDADTAVSEVMRARGYPMADFERRAEDISVDHPHVVNNYRAAHEIALTEQQGRATTEDLRRGLVLYRDLFDELLETSTASAPTGRQ